MRSKMIGLAGLSLLFIIPLGLTELLGLFIPSWPAGFSLPRRIVLWAAFLCGALAWAGVFERELPLGHGFIWTVVFTAAIVAATSSLLNPLGWVVPPLPMVLGGLILAWAYRKR